MRNNELRYLIGSIALFLVAAVILLLLPAKDQNDAPLRSTTSDPKAYEIDETFTGPDGNRYRLRKNVETYLILGIDKTAEELKALTRTGGQTDVLLLVAVDAGNKTFSVVPINRDTITLVHTIDDDGHIFSDRFAQICLAHAATANAKANCENTIRSVSYLMSGLPIRGYLSFTLDTIADVADAVGGVDVTIPQDMTAAHPSFVEGAKVHLSGDLTEAFVRARMGLGEENNSNRLGRQQEFFQSWMTQAKKTMGNDQAAAVRFYEDNKDRIETNLTENKISGLLGNFLKYQFGGFYSIRGENAKGVTFNEFHADPSSIMEILTELFYEKV